MPLQLNCHCFRAGPLPPWRCHPGQHDSFAATPVEQWWMARWFPDGLKWQLPLEAHVNRMRGAFRRLRRPLSVTAAAPGNHLFDVCCCKNGRQRVGASLSLCGSVILDQFLILIVVLERRKNPIGDITLAATAQDVTDFLWLRSKKEFSIARHYRAP